MSSPTVDNKLTITAPPPPETMLGEANRTFVCAFEACLLPIKHLRLLGFG